MLNSRAVLAAAILASATACHTDRVTSPITVPSVLLKDIQVPNLPSPYYHFDYDSSGRIRGVSFASQLTNDSVFYDGARVAELHNTGGGNGARLVYVYDDSGRVALVKMYDLADTIYELMFLTYKGRQLTSLERDRRVTGGYVIDKTMTFTYYADGNVKDIVDHRPAVQDFQAESTTTDHFENYDDGINVDGFTLLHNDFFDHLVILPGVTLQGNNARKETFTGSVGADYDATFVIAYDDKGRPTAKTGEVTLLNGASAGTKVPTSQTYTYY